MSNIEKQLKKFIEQTNRELEEMRLRSEAIEIMREEAENVIRTYYDMGYKDDNIDFIDEILVFPSGRVNPYAEYRARNIITQKSAESGLTEAQYKTELNRLRAEIRSLQTENKGLKSFIGTVKSYISANFEEGITQYLANMGSSPTDMAYKLKMEYGIDIPISEIANQNNWKGTDFYYENIIVHTKFTYDGGYISGIEGNM